MERKVTIWVQYGSGKPIPAPALTEIIEEVVETRKASAVTELRQYIRQAEEIAEEALCD